MLTSQAIAVSESMTYSLVKNMADGNLLVIASERIAALSEILSAVLEPLASFPGACASLLLSI